MLREGQIGVLASLVLTMGCGARSEIAGMSIVEAGGDEQPSFDARAFDAGDDFPDSCHVNGGAFACADMTCDSNSEYCVEVGGALDHGICRALPNGCNTTCIVGFVVPGCVCAVDAGRITVSCPY